MIEPIKVLKMSTKVIRKSFLHQVMDVLVSHRREHMIFYLQKMALMAKKITCMCESKIEPRIQRKKRK